MTMHNTPSGSKLISLTITAIVCSVLFIISLHIDYHWEFIKEHVRFRRDSPLQNGWISSPQGTLRVYLFNVTNAASFLNGTDLRLKIEEVGPIAYRLSGRNEIISQTKDSLIFRRYPHEKLEFDPLASCSPDILNQTITMPNIILLSSAAKLHDWVFWVRHAFNAITINESAFLKNTINYFLWDFTLPWLSLLASHVPNIVSNCGLLYNAMKPKELIYNVKIGVDNGVENFFRVNTFNNKTYFPQQREFLKRAKKSDEYCPIILENSFDNSLFPPFLTPETELNIIATESCRTHKLNYDRAVDFQGFTGYRYTLSDTNTNKACLDNSLGIKLPNGIFDASRCMSSKYSEHIDGLLPDQEKHEAEVILEPTMGIPLEEKYRFQVNTPMPDMKGFNKDLRRFSHMVVPSFWYEFDMDDRSTVESIAIQAAVYVIPHIQLTLMIVFLVLDVYCCLSIYLLLTNKTLRELFCKTYQK
uniref:Scavenger receptor class B member 1 n=1 Tax=Glossina brevipalpis TaxID=37001 RepID=A0A1A9WI69_9MUSC